MKWFKPIQEPSLKPWAKRRPWLARVAGFIQLTLLFPILLVTVPLMLIIFPTDLLAEALGDYRAGWVRVLSPWTKNGS